MYFDQWPIRQPSLLFAGLALNQTDFLKLWLSLKPDSIVPEVIRNWFIRLRPIGEEKDWIVGYRKCRLRKRSE
jgi:hypothetical protein